MFKLLQITCESWETFLQLCISVFKLLIVSPSLLSPSELFILHLAMYFLLDVFIDSFLHRCQIEVFGQHVQRRGAKFVNVHR